jgi:hypothetical protein
MASTGHERDRTAGLLIVAVAFLAALTISWWAQREATSDVAPPPAPPSTEGLEGFASQLDPVGALETARGLTLREEFVGMVLTGVKPDGTVDMTQPGSSLRFTFQSERGEGPQPPRPKGTLPGRGYCGMQIVHVKSTGMVADPDKPTYPCHAKRRALPDPRCGPKDVWDAAKKRGVPTDRAARIEYYRAQAGPAWRFELPGSRHRFSLYGDCVRDLNAAESIGSVP